MTPDLSIREATADDYDAVCELHVDLDAAHRQRVPWLFREPDEPPRPRSHFARLLESADSTVLVAQSAARLSGTVFLLMRSTPDISLFIPQRFGVIDSLVVAPGQRRKGVGAALVRAAERWASERGAAGLELNVYEWNAEARAFYVALGFTPLMTRLHRRPIDRP